MTAGVIAALRGDTPEQVHDAWMRDKIAAGWVHGPVRDVEKRQHPCIAPYASLPAPQRAKDALFLAVVRAMATALDSAPSEGE